MGASLDHRRMAEISSSYTEVLSPTGVEQLRAVGRVMGLNCRSRVVDLGCGYAEALRVWAAEFGIVGVGVDSHRFLCDRARLRVQEEGLGDRVQIVEADAAQWQCEPGEFDVAACIGACGIWGGYEGTVCHLRGLVRPDGRLLVGESYYLSAEVPQALVDYEGKLDTEEGLLRIVHSVGCELEYIARSTAVEWDRYVCSGWHDTLHWLDDNPGHPDRATVIERLHRGQRMYLEHRRKYQGFALHVLRPNAYE